MEGRFDLMETSLDRSFDTLGMVKQKDNGELEYYVRIVEIWEWVFKPDLPRASAL